MLFTEVLSKHNLTKDVVSHSIKVKIGRYEKFASAVEAERGKLTTAKDSQKEKIESDIKTGEENMAAINEELVAAIEKYHANYDANQKRVANIAKARENNKAKHGVKKEKIDLPEAEPVNNGTPTPSLTPDDIVHTDPIHDPKDEKKKKSGSGWLVGTLLVIGLGALGIHIYNKNK